MIALVAFAVLGLAAFAWFMLRAHRTPRELRGDWWSRFERDFRVYAQQSAARNTHARNRRPPPR